MIVRMSKIVVMGPLELLMDTLAIIAQLGIMQVDEKTNDDTDSEFTAMPLLVDKEKVLQHQSLCRMKA